MGAVNTRMASSESWMIVGVYISTALWKPHVGPTIVNGAIKRLEAIASNFIEDRRLGPALVLGTPSRCPPN